MELIIGGAYQGKLSFAVKDRVFKQDELYDMTNGLPDKTYPCLYHLEAFVRDEAGKGSDADAILAAIMPIAGDAVVISREIGAGIVPTDPFERRFREIHGSVLRRLAEKANSVNRVICGLNERLK